MNLLFLRRDECGHCDRAERYLRQLFDVHVVRSKGIGDRLPDEVRGLPVDAVFAFRSHIIIPRWLIDKAKICLNFHPGPPERPGIGCVNFALMEGDEHYGSTCHHVVEEIDAGPIVSVSRFPIHDSDSVASLLERAYDYLICQLYDVAPIVAEGRSPELCGAKWTRKATRKADLDRLLEIPAGCPPEEIRRRIRATSFGEFGPYMMVNGVRVRVHSPPE